MKNIAKEQFLGLEFAFPHPQEQEALAGVLTRHGRGTQPHWSSGCAKTRALKQAMMQELLTGRTRLVSPQEADA